MHVHGGVKSVAAKPVISARGTKRSVKFLFSHLIIKDEEASG